MSEQDGIHSLDRFNLNFDENATTALASFGTPVLDENGDTNAATVDDNLLQFEGDNLTNGSPQHIARILLTMWYAI